jgi:subtilase family serine protease
MRTKLSAFAVAVSIVALGFGTQGAEAKPGRSNHRVCTSTNARAVACDARVIETEGSVTPFVTNAPYGISPTRMKWIYGWSTSPTAGAGKTIAVIGAADAPTIASDLATFSTQFGLPSCTVAGGCFRKVNQNGGSTYPAADAGWSFETSLDVEWAHAIAPGAHILLVEASSPSLSDLGPAIDFAKAHAQFVSMSWGTPEFSTESSFDQHFAWSTTSFFASAGDTGLPAQYPSASPWVVSVGGTSLTGLGTSSFQEVGWGRAGGGCSAYEPQAPAQASAPNFAQVSCAHRATPDISADADPNTGVPVYDSTTYQNVKGWFLAGGTSLAAPMIAARSAIRGYKMGAPIIYQSTNLHWRDVTSGYNGAPCLPGYDLCTGRGAWIGP